MVGIPGCIQDVVADLKCKSKVLCKIQNCMSFHITRFGKGCSKLCRCNKQRSGFAAMNEFKRFQVDFLSLRFEIHDLSADDSFRTNRARKDCDNLSSEAGTEKRFAVISKNSKGSI